MHIILGGTGHIGSSLTSALLEQGEAVTVVGRTRSKARDLESRGAHFVMADVNDVDELRRIIERGKRLFILNPPADPSTDTDIEERKTLASILAALEGANLEKVVAESTYGAQSGKHIGDLGVLYEMEQALTALPVPVTIIRGAYYMTNWDIQLQAAREKGVLRTFFPIDFKIPMVDPVDIGKIAARFMVEPVEATGLRYVEGPDLYSSEDVAIAFTTALGKPVEAVEIPRARWMEAFESIGFSEKAAVSFANMTDVTITSPEFPDPDIPVRGEISLQSHVAKLVEQSSEGDQ
jgi:uncharacterized protein YbjT (DUF2867 family)